MSFLGDPSVGMMGGGGFWDVSTAVYASKSKDVSAQENQPFGIAFSSDGTKMYVLGFTNDTVYQYTLSTAWDVSTASYASKSKSVSSEEATPIGLTFSADGSKMYICGEANDTVYQYTLSTPWDVSTASYASKSKSISAEGGNPHCLSFNTDGDKMFVGSYAAKTVFQYTLSTPWDVSTASYASKSKDVSTQEANGINGLAFQTDGKAMFVSCDASHGVFQYTLSTAWDVSTASYASKSFTSTSQDSTYRGIAFNLVGTALYLVGGDNDTVYQYTLAG